VGGKPNLTVYDDINGYPTIGYGHLVKEGEDFSKGITKKQALDLLRKDAGGAESFVNSHLSGGVGYAEFDALVSVAYTSQRGACAY
jgi:lysozyme